MGTSAPAGAGRSVAAERSAAVGAEASPVRRGDAPRLGLTLF